MPFRLLADVVVLLHAAFVLFVVAGGLLALRWRWAPWVHVPCFLWGGAVEFAGWICPLTPLESWLGERGGTEAYPGDFVGRYLVPCLYPEGLTRGVQVALGLLVLLVNLGLYGYLLARERAKAEARRASAP